MSISFENNISALIKSAVEEAIEKERDEVIKLAVEEFEKRIRSNMAHAVLAINNQFSIQRIGSDIVIHVKMEKP